MDYALSHPGCLPSHGWLTHRLDFKSYKGHHVLLFGDAYFTSIIGPNGSGKSNSFVSLSRQQDNRRELALTGSFPEWTQSLLF